MTEHSKERDEQTTQDILDTVYQERLAQHEKWGRQRLPSVKSADQVGTVAFPLEVSEAYGLPSESDAKEACDGAAKLGICTFGHIMVEEAVEVLNAPSEEDRAIELYQLAAVCVQWAEEIERQRAEDMEARVVSESVECPECSKLGGADLPVHHTPPACSPMQLHDDESCGWTGLGTCPTCGDEVGRVL